jgi:tripartite-type tricarboxylate transporter receptor subunit TctC
MKKLLHLLIASLMMTALAVAAKEPIKIVSSFPTGSGPDTLARVIAVELEKSTGRPVIVDNKPGGNGAVAFAAANNDSNKNNVLVFASNDNLILFPVLSGDMQFTQALQPLRGIFATELVLATGSGITADQLRSSIDQSSSFGSWGVGSAPHLFGLEFNKKIAPQQQLTHVPYRDYGQWFGDIMTNRLTFSFVTIASTHKLHEAGRLQYHAVTTDRRNVNYPNVPTIKELLGFDADAQAWAGMYVPSSVSAADREVMFDHLDKAMRSEAVNRQINMLQYSAMALSYSDFVKKTQTEQQAFAKYIKENNISIK